MTTCFRGEWYLYGTKWPCDYSEQWGNLTGRPCVAAGLSTVQVIRRGEEAGTINSNASFYQLADCEERKPFVCYESFSKYSFQLRSSKR